MDSGWLAFLGSDPKDAFEIADNDASDAGLDIFLKLKICMNINDDLLKMSHLYKLSLTALVIFGR